MTLKPQKQKYKKYQKGKAFNKIRIINKRFNYGQLCLRALSASRVDGNQIATLYNFLKKKLKKKGCVTLCIFPSFPLTKKPAEVRMGKGKGNVNKWIARVKSGSAICEISTANIPLAIKILKAAKFKLSIKTKIFKRNI